MLNESVQFAICNLVIPIYFKCLSVERTVYASTVKIFGCGFSAPDIEKDGFIAV